MDNVKQPIEGASAFDTIAKLLFGGLENILDGAAQYEKEMGVLKQFNYIKVRKKDDPDVTDELEIKLSPIRDKQNMYYVEARFLNSNTDVSELNGKGIQIDKSNKTDFKKKVDQFLDKLGFERIDPSEADEDDDDQTDESETTEEETDDLTALIADLIDDAEDYYSRERVQGEITHPVTEKPQYVYIAPSFKIGEIPNIDVKLSAVDGKTGNDLPNVSDFEFSVDACTGEIDIDQSDFEIDDEIRILSLNVFTGIIREQMNEYADDEDIQNLQTVLGSTVVKASLIKEKDSDNVSLTAIKASCDVRAAMDIICDIIEDPSFKELLDDESEKSFMITDSDDSEYNVEEIEEFEVDNECYVESFNQLSLFYNKLKVYRWSIGIDAWFDTRFLDVVECICNELLDQTAKWVIYHTDSYPVPISPFGNNCTDLNEVKDAEGKISIDLICDSVESDLSDIIDMLEIYYVNMEHDEQAVLDDCFARLKDILLYR